MNIADKLITIAQNMQRVGKALDDCNDVLVTKGVETAETLEQVPHRIGEIVQEEDFLRYCWQPKLPGLGLFDKEELVLNFDYAESLDRPFFPEYGITSYSNLKIKHLTINFKKLAVGASARQMCLFGGSTPVLEHITINGDLSQATNTLQLFTSVPQLRVVDGTPIDLSSSTNIGAVANYCTNLEEIRFAPNTIKVSISLQQNLKLSDATIQSVIDGLADLTGQAAQTLTLHATVGAKLTDAQKGAITAKNWTLVY